jgi:replication initiation protein RepC
MAEDNCAHEAPQGRHARASTGFRRWSPGLLQTDRTAEAFAGLPEGVKSHGQLLAAFKEAAPQLGISPRLVHAVDWLFCFTQVQDWQKDSRPIVWPHARTQQEALGLSPTQVMAINRSLIELGLISMKDSPNGKRYGYRDPKGRITEAYGFDLSPIATRYAEFRRLAQERKEERRTMGRLRRRATVARKAIIQILETAAEYSFEGEEWQILAQDMTALARALRGVERVEEMELGVASLERRQIAARERIEQLLETVDSDPKGPENRPHYNNYQTSAYPEQDTVIAARKCSRGREGPLPSRQEPEVRKQPEWGKEDGITPDELVQLAPKLKPYLRSPRPTWSDIVDAADYLRGDLGVSKSLWAEACGTMNRYRAAVAVAIVSAKEPEYFRGTPGGYFRGMVAKDKAQELHLDRTIWAWRRTTASASAGQGRGRD